MIKDKLNLSSTKFFLTKMKIICFAMQFKLNNNGKKKKK